MGLKPDAPKSPDPTKTANTQMGYNQTAGQNTVNMNSLNNNGVFGSGTVTKDASGNVTGQTQSLNPALQGGANSTANAFSSIAGQLPTDPINWDSTTAPKIAQQNYDAYSAMTAPQRAQQQNQQNVTLTDRGIPVGSEVWNNASTNLNNSFDLADTNAAAQAWNAVPGMQGQLTQNQIAQNNQPYKTAANSLGLLQGLNGLAPNAQLGQGSVAAPNYSGLVQNQYDNQMQQYNSQMQGLGSLASTGLGLLTAPMTGGASMGLSSSLLGMGASKLFGGGSPSYASNNMFNLNNL